MPVSTFSEVATVAEEVATTGETVGAVDLLTVSQQLDQVITWQMAQLCTMWVFIGVVIGVAVALVIGRFFR